MTKSGRKPDTKIIYTPEQTRRYKSQMSRYEKGLKLARSNLVHKIDDKTYRVESARSPVGYWEVKLGGGKISVTWSGMVVIKSFEERNFSGCGSYLVWIAYSYRSGNGETYSPVSNGEAFAAFKTDIRNSRFAALTPLEALTRQGNSNQQSTFPGGIWIGLVGYSAAIGPPPYSPPGYNPGLPYYLVYGRLYTITNPSLFNTGSDLMAALESDPYGGASAEVIAAVHPSQGQGVCEMPYEPGSRKNKITWNCNYDLTEEEFSPNWSVASSAGIIRNDRGQNKTLVACPPPRPASNIKLESIGSVTGNGGSYACTCPDFSLSEGAFNPPAFPSMSQARNWQASNAGCPTWADGKRRCCHIVAVQDVRGEAIPVPQDIPTGEA